MRAEFRRVTVATDCAQGPAILLEFDTKAEEIAFHLLRQESEKHGGIGILNWGGTSEHTTCLIGYQENKP